ncbi:hydroxypyruvate isomerase [Rhizobiales bacterium GAS113]|nr:hydroxypyruvate isomerase [Rhizobiales bacterium GAS113]SEC37507.1 hydroxypyruvate isomerase [Rhizobiales bacterium GAS188]
MPRFSAHLSFLWQELPFLERLVAAKTAGFPAVECAVPEAPAAEMRRRVEDLGLAFIGINTSPGEEQGGRTGLAAMPGRESAFAANLDAALTYAATAGVKHIHVLAGVIDGIARPQAEATFLNNMETGIRMAEKAGVMLVIEGLNSRDRPGYFLSRSQEAFAIAARFASPHLKVMFDTYHSQIMEGDIVARLEANLSQIGHIQISGVPNRSEPDSGELNHREIFAAIDRLAWAGYVGCEYKPRTTTQAGLGWIKALTGE